MEGIRFSAEEILRCTGGEAENARPDEATGISTDSRSVGEGDLFISLKGPRFDGHDYVVDVLGRGAWGAVVERDTWRRHGAMREEALRSGGGVITVADTERALGDLARCHRDRLPVRVAGVTGSNGKTTTKEMIASIAAQRWKVHRSLGNFNNLIGLPLSIFGLREDHEVSVLEMGMNHRGEIARLAEIARPEVGVVTNVAPAHLEHIGTVEGVAEAKAELLGALGEKGTAVVNADDPWRSVMESAAAGPVVTFGLSGADVRAESIRCEAAGTSFVLETPLGSTPVATAFLGTHNVRNALAAAAAAVALGAEIGHIRAGLQAVEPVSMRFSRTSYRNGIRIVNDAYNANPESMKAALEAVAIIRGASPLMLVLGDMLELGAAAPGEHRRLGEGAAAAGADFIVAVGDHARSIADGAVGAGFDAGRIETAHDASAAASAIQGRIEPGMLVLLKASRGVGLEAVLTRLRNDNVLQGED